MFFKKKSNQIDKNNPTLIEEAKKFPNGYIYALDPEFEGKEEVPPEHIKGAYKVDKDGKIEGEFIPNSNYRSK
ncbi:MAG: hypothetical protein VR77_06465 [Flavobacteriales bacterium BRH_c54]|nr:MAG: hypothetical protein VR77_06465 [Flavobacteriales bacterium BRH_c54]